MNSKPDRIYELDVLRGIAALAVVFYHLTTRYTQIYGRGEINYFLNFPYGKLGVDLFFIISGFVIYMTLNNTNSIKDFAVKRIVRLYPAYIAAVILTFSITSCYGLSDRSVSFIHAMINLTMLQGFLPGVPHVDNAYWTLTFELIFYSFIATVFALKLTKRIEYIAWSWLLFSAALKAVTIFVPKSLFKLVGYIIVADYCNLFIAGMMFYHLKKQKYVKFHVLIAACLIYEFVFRGLLSGSVVLVFFGLFYALIYDHFRLEKNRLFSFLGAISYSLYLVNQNIGYVFINVLEKNGFTHEIFVLIPLAGVILLAAIITYTIEKPMQRYARDNLNSVYKRKTEIILSSTKQH